MGGWVAGWVGGAVCGDTLSAVSRTLVLHTLRPRPPARSGHLLGHHCGGGAWATNHYYTHNRVPKSRPCAVLYIYVVHNHAGTSSDPNAAFQFDGYAEQFDDLETALYE